MATVAIIHAAEDALPARALAEKLRQAKLTVVLEKQPGEDLRAALKDAKVTIALWSPRSVGQAALVEDAGFAKGKSKLFHACMQNAALPDAFRNEKATNLTGWRGEDDFAAWRDLAKQVTDKAGVSPLPAPAPKPPSGFFQPGLVRTEAQQAAAGQRAAPRQAPQQRPAQQTQRAAPPRSAPAAATRAPTGAAEKSGGGGRMALIGIATFVVVALAGGGGYWFWSQTQNASATTAAWKSVDTGDADALRAFIDGDPGDFRDEAQQALGELEDRTFEAASDADTIETFEAFLNEFPESEHAIAARGRIAELQSLQPPEGATPAEIPATPTAPDPDLVPPGSASPDTGPATLTPPAPEPSPPAEDAPTN